MVKMIECYKCEWSHIIPGHVGFSLHCERFDDVTALDYQLPECPEYKERDYYSRCDE